MTLKDKQIKQLNETIEQNSDQEKKSKKSFQSTIGSLKQKISKLETELLVKQEKNKET